VPEDNPARLAMGQPNYSANLGPAAPAIDQLKDPIVALGAASPGCTPLPSPQAPVGPLDARQAAANLTARDSSLALARQPLRLRSRSGLARLDVPARRCIFGPGRNSRPLEVVAVDPLQLVGLNPRDADVVLEHQLSQLSAVDQHDLALEAVDVLLGLSREL